ncbi:hypothetical protein IG631_02049 [Alternaria alternata]|nr:hypothetical protein IG631_02049 [Alternaria alternata]
MGGGRVRRGNVMQRTCDEHSMPAVNATQGRMASARKTENETSPARIRYRENYLEEWFS